MSVLHKELRARARRGRLMEQSLYREELNRLARERAGHIEQANGAAARIARLLHGATQAGVSMVEIAELTGISRPTLYRMLADVRAEQDIRALARQLEHVIGKATDELGEAPLINPLAEYLNMDEGELRLRLEQVFPHLRREIEGLGTTGLTDLVDLLPGLPKIEKIVLNMLLLQRLPVEEVARSIRRDQREAIIWAALGLLRILPGLRSGVSQTAA